MPVPLALNLIAPPLISPLASNLPVDAKVKLSAVMRIVPTVVLLVLLLPVTLLTVTCALELTVMAPWKLKMFARMLTKGLAPAPMMLP